MEEARCASGPSSEYPASVPGWAEPWLRVCSDDGDLLLTDAQAYDEKTKVYRGKFNALWTGNCKRKYDTTTTALHGATLDDELHSSYIWCTHLLCLFYLASILKMSYRSVVEMYGYEGMLCALTVVVTLSDPSILHNWRTCEWVGRRSEEWGISVC